MNIRDCITYLLLEICMLATVSARSAKSDMSVTFCHPLSSMRSRIVNLLHLPYLRTAYLRLCLFIYALLVEDIVVQRCSISTHPLVDIKDSPIMVQNFHGKALKVQLPEIASSSNLTQVWYLAFREVLRHPPPVLPATECKDLENSAMLPRPVEFGPCVTEEVCGQPA
jgi:hypothetical protein